MQKADTQPPVIRVLPRVRLRAFDPDSASESLMAELLTWYQDRQTLIMLDGPGATRYDAARLAAMYRYMRDHGELYLIEHHDTDRLWHPIGDVALQANAMPILLSPANRRRGVARAVVQALVGRARELGWKSVHVSDIYSGNTASRQLYEACGFIPAGRTEHGHRYVLKL